MARPPGGLTVEPPALAVGDDGVLRSTRYGDRYHPAEGALAQAEGVFLAGNGLPTRWRGRDRFVVCELGFGLGTNFLATRAAWRVDADRPHRLDYLAIERHPLSREQLGSIARDPSLAASARQLLDAWPPRTSDLHRLAFDDGAVVLHLAFGDVEWWLRELVARVDAFYLDGFAPDRNPGMWSAMVFASLHRLAAADATAATWSAARAVRDRLATAGFVVERKPGFAGKRDMTTARFAPHGPRRLARLGPRRFGRGDVVAVIGAGLAGAAVTRALDEQGVAVVLLEAAATTAHGASSIAAGLFHGAVRGDDNTHARFSRAAAFQTTAAVRQALAAHRIDGRLDGVLRVETPATNAARPDEATAATDESDVVDRLLGVDAASRLAGVALAGPARWFRFGGLVDASALARAFIADASHRPTIRFGSSVARLVRLGERWRLVDAHDHALLDADAVVVAAGPASIDLLGPFGARDWPLSASRGQTSEAAADALGGWMPPRLPIAGAGYALPTADGGMLFGATATHDDDGAVRLVDHAANVERLRALFRDPPPIAVELLVGKAGHRLAATDRLPVAGAVPSLGIADALARVQARGPRMRHARLDQARFVPREPGLYVCTALGSRGIVWSTLAARIVAAAVTGAPMPVGASLVDAVDPARFVSRAVRRAAASAGDQPAAGPIDGGSSG